MIGGAIYRNSHRSKINVALFAHYLCKLCLMFTFNRYLQHLLVLFYIFDTKWEAVTCGRIKVTECFFLLDRRTYLAHTSYKFGETCLAGSYVAGRSNFGDPLKKLFAYFQYS